MQARMWVCIVEVETLEQILLNELAAKKQRVGYFQEGETYLAQVRPPVFPFPLLGRKRRTRGSLGSCFAIGYFVIKPGMSN